MTAGRVDQPQLGNQLRNHETRIRQLEAVPPIGTSYEKFSEGQKVIPSTDTEYFPWVHDSGATLLDLTTPDRPVILADAVYSFALNVAFDQRGTLPTASYPWNAGLQLDPDGTPEALAFFAGQIGWVAGASVYQSSGTIPVTRFVAAGTILGAFATQFDTHDLTFGLTGYLAKL